MKKIFAAAVFCFAAIFLSSCEYGLDEAFFRENNVNLRSSILSRVDAPSGLPSVYKVAVITDVHFGAIKERFDERFFAWLRSTKPAFVVCLGDVMEHGLESEGEAYKEFSAKVKAICGNEIYTIVGNHDLYNSGWDVFRDKIFPHTSFYNFRTQKFSWYFIDSASGFIGNGQMTSLRRAMSQDSFPKIVLTHIPVYSSLSALGYFSMQNTKESDMLISLFAANKVKIVLEGHTHKYEKIDIDDYSLYNVPGYLSAESWAVLTVDENNGTVRAEIVK